MVIPPPNVTGKLHLGYLVDDFKVRFSLIGCYGLSKVARKLK